jgi:hypothetical protein
MKRTALSSRVPYAEGIWGERWQRTLGQRRRRLQALSRHVPQLKLPPPAVVVDRICQQCQLRHCRKNTHDSAANNGLQPAAKIMR